MRASIMVLITFLIIGATAISSRADDRRKPRVSLEQMKARVAEATKRDKRVIVIFKDGSSISGNPRAVTDETFTITQTRDFFGDGKSFTVRYADVADMKWRNPFIKAVKNIGVFSAFTAINPFWGFIEV